MAAWGEARHGHPVGLVRKWGPWGLWSPEAHSWPQPPARLSPGRDPRGAGRCLGDARGPQEGGREYGRVSREGDLREAGRPDDQGGVRGEGGAVRITAEAEPGPPQGHLRVQRPQPHPHPLCPRSLPWPSQPQPGQLSAHPVPGRWYSPSPHRGCQQAQNPQNRRPSGPAVAGRGLVDVRGRWRQSGALRLTPGGLCTALRTRPAGRSHSLPPGGYFGAVPRGERPQRRSVFPGRASPPGHRVGEGGSGVRSPAAPQLAPGSGRCARGTLGTGMRLPGARRPWGPEPWEPWGGRGRAWAAGSWQRGGCRPSSRDCPPAAAARSALPVLSLGKYFIKETGVKKRPAPEP